MKHWCRFCPFAAEQPVKATLLFAATFFGSWVLTRSLLAEAFDPGMAVVASTAIALGVLCLKPAARPDPEK